MYFSVPDDAKPVVSIRGEGEVLQEVVVHGIYPDLVGYWDGEQNCWYLWPRPLMSITADKWTLHLQCITEAGGEVTWERHDILTVETKLGPFKVFHYTQAGQPEAFKEEADKNGPWFFEPVVDYDASNVYSNGHPTMEAATESALAWGLLESGQYIL